jgi:tyrosyl-tRNA synthetase
VLTDQEIEANFQNWKSQASKVLNFDKISIVHNGDWLDKLTYAEIVKLMAQTTVQQLIERDMFQERLKKSLPIFGHEIMYPLLQGYDSVAMEVDLEIGGTDQTFNMMMGRHLLRTMKNKEKWVLTTPIIPGTDGRKMSKSYGNFIALNEQPREMYGKLMSIPDSLIVEYFTLLTDEPLHSIEVMKNEMSTGKNPMLYKKKLAFTITQMYHSKAEALEAAVFFEKTVQQKSVPDAVPEVVLSDKQFSILQLLQACEPNTSASQLRRLIDQRAVEVTLKNREKVKPTSWQDTFQSINIDVVRIGKRKYYRIVTK